MVDSSPNTRYARLLVAVFVPMALTLASGGLAAALAQTELPEEEVVEETIEWNFRPASVARDETSLQERWAAPFAVESTGRPAPRPPRRVVVLRDTAEARRLASAQAAVGQSATEVTEAATPAASRPAPATSPTASPASRQTPAASRPTPPASRPTPAASRPATGAARTHRVEYGETWYGIAREYRVSSRDLAAANPDVDPERLRSGTVLRIPAAGGAVSAPRTHTVGRGDTLFGIARRYEVSVTALRAANRITDDVVRLGQTLVIPREEESR